MKQFLYFASIFILFFGPAGSIAQVNHFIYLQTENKQPFYLKMDKKILNSTVSGYLIIPKLQDGTLDFSIGFLNAENKEYEFSCSINNKDAGYIVKNFADKGWGLFNLQTLQVVMSGTKDVNIVQANKTDAFSNLLSDVVNDPAIKQDNRTTSIAKQDNKSQLVVAESALVKTEQKIDSGEINTKKESPVEKLLIPVAVGAILPQRIIKKDAVTDTDGLHITYVDVGDNRQDTIDLVIPNDQKVNKNLTATGSLEESRTSDAGSSKEIDTTHVMNTVYDTVPNSKVETGEDKKFIDIDISKPLTANIDSNQEKVVINNNSNTNGAMIISDCKNIASEEDFLKLRKKMASAKNEEEMISSAKKAFKTKCFTTDQIKNLGVLFLNDSGRYNFFDMAYSFVSDSNSYKTLETQLIDEYYKSRFKAMIRH